MPKSFPRQYVGLENMDTVSWINNNSISIVKYNLYFKQVIYRDSFKIMPISGLGTDKV